MEEVNYNRGDVKFKIIEADRDDAISSQLMLKLRTGQIDGYLVKSALSLELVEKVHHRLGLIDRGNFLETNTGHIFPSPFATVSNLNERLDNYIAGNTLLKSMEWDGLFEAIHGLFTDIGYPYSVKTPSLCNNKHTVVPATFRFFTPEKGGLYVHCGHLFQNQSPVFYEAVEPMSQDFQLSFFFVLQNPVEGGELTLYDMLWNRVNGKDCPENNEFVLDKDGSKVFLDAVDSVKIRPSVGDVLIFNGGAIWHRVEEFKGPISRITLGGFMNFSQDGTTCFYWS
jgi:hypothetical protein